MKGFIKFSLGCFVVLLLFCLGLVYKTVKSHEDKNYKWREEVRLSSGSSIWINRTVSTKMWGNGSHFHRKLKNISIHFDDSENKMPSDWSSQYEPIVLDQDEKGDWFIIALCCKLGFKYTEAYPRLPGFDYSKWRNDTHYIEYRFKEGEWSQFPVRHQFIEVKMPVNLITNIAQRRPDNKANISLKIKNKNFTSYRKLYQCLSDKEEHETTCD